MMSNRIKLADIRLEKIFPNQLETAPRKSSVLSSRQVEKEERTISPEPGQVFYRFRTPVERAKEERLKEEIYFERYGKKYVRPPVLVEREEKKIVEKRDERNRTVDS